MLRKMDAHRLKKLLDDVKSGQLDVEAALEELRRLPYDDLGFAKVDTHRGLRTGFPEVVFCPGKTNDQIVEILKRLSEKCECVLATRADPEVCEAVVKRIPDATYNKDARIITVGSPQHSEEELAAEKNYVMVVTGGTADIPVAEEAALVASAMGSRVERGYDVGVAGIHRLLDKKDLLMGANVLIAVAGMEGALASVVGGLVDRPVIAVPTSVGYGASFNGVAALLAMLNSCAAGVSVVNIDNGFGAGYLAHIINKTNE